MPRRQKEGISDYWKYPFFLLALVVYSLVTYLWYKKTPDSYKAVQETFFRWLKSSDPADQILAYLFATHSLLSLLALSAVTASFAMKRWGDWKPPQEEMKRARFCLWASLLAVPSFLWGTKLFIVFFLPFSWLLFSWVRWIGVPGRATGYKPYTKPPVWSDEKPGYKPEPEEPEVDDNDPIGVRGNNGR